MDKVTQYRECVQTLLRQYAKDDVSSDEVEVQLIFDIERDHYQWMNVGWQEFNRIYRCIVHFDIKEGKIWLQQNLTDQNPAAELVEMGVLRGGHCVGLAASLQTTVHRVWCSIGGKSR
jgi:XisI protein